MGNDIDRLGGIGRFMNELALGFYERGFETHLVGVTPTRPSEKLSISRSQEIKEHILWSELAPENWSLRTRRQKLNPARQARYSKRNKLKEEAVGNLRALLKSWGPETLIICTQVFGMEHLKEAGFNHHNPSMPCVVGQYHGSYDMCVETNDLKRIIRGYSEIDRFVTLTERDSILFRKAQLHNSTWIPNPVTVQSSGNATTARRNVVVSLGRYNTQKSLDQLLLAWKPVAIRHPEWRLELYGEGEERSKLESLLIEEDILNARLMGMANDVSYVLYSSKIHAMSSQYEGLPIAIVEAAMAGVPTISYNCAPGITELIDDERTGLVVPHNSITALTAAINRLIENEDELSRMSQMGITNANQFSREKIMDKWIALLDDIAR